jgi:hypothetical protein
VAAGARANAAQRARNPSNVKGQRRLKQSSSRVIPKQLGVAHVGMQHVHTLVLGYPELCCHLCLDPLHCACSDPSVVAILRIPTSPFLSALRIAASVAALMVGRPSVLPWARARSLELGEHAHHLRYCVAGERRGVEPLLAQHDRRPAPRSSRAA